MASVQQKLPLLLSVLALCLFVVVYVRQVMCSLAAPSPNPLPLCTTHTNTCNPPPLLHTHTHTHTHTHAHTHTHTHTQTHVGMLYIKHGLSRSSLSLTPGLSFSCRSYTCHLSLQMTQVTYPCPSPPPPHPLCFSPVHPHLILPAGRYHPADLLGSRQLSRPFS